MCTHLFTELTVCATVIFNMTKQISCVILNVYKLVVTLIDVHQSVFNLYNDYNSQI